ncbi:MAG: CPBP family intramembrane metalloprotease [Blastocatellia bacterium]|nr:CPBP family intramembrane metalloprotease [Blastocatellia bacterium]
MADHSLVVEPYHEESLPDPDRPHWGPLAGIGVWIFSFVALFMMSVLALGVSYMIDTARGISVPGLRDGPEFNEWAMSPNTILVQVLSTVAGHALTMAVCWAVVTGVGRRPFWESLGWEWHGGSARTKTLFVLGVTAIMYFTFVALAQLIPSTSETLFDQLLKTSRQVRYAVAFMAVFTAPLVEEVVYRGVLFSALRSRFGPSPTIAFVTLLFAGVHVIQYWGNWAGLIGLTILSLVLTLIRAETKSIFPCVAVHLVFNTVNALIIVFAYSS